MAFPPEGITMTETMYPSPELGLTPPTSSMTGDVSSSDSPTGATAMAREYAEGVMKAKSSAMERASDERDKAVQSIRSFVEELRSMESSSATSGVATSFVGQAANRAESLASYLESRPPQDMLEDARQYARSHPAVFLAGAALVGTVLGRATRAAASAAADNGVNGKVTQA